METRTCIKCGAVRPLDQFHLHHDKNGKITRRNVCNLCENARKRAHYHNEKPILLKSSPTDGNPEHFKPEISDLVTVYLNLIHWRPLNLRTISLEKYNKHFNLDVTKDEFTQIENSAEQRLNDFGYMNPQSAILDSRGKYLVIGDTFGTHTPECIFKLLKLIVEREKISAVIVLGHNLDDENIISNLITSTGASTIIVAMKDELKDLHAQRGYGYTIVQDHVQIGMITLRNQEHITPYVKTALGSLDPMLFPGQMIVNCTRQELSVRPTPKGWMRHFVASPGALADPHVVTTINRLIFNDGGHLSVKPTNKDSYLKHRKNETDKWLWERGFIILHNDNFVQRRIIVDGGTAYAVSNGVVINSNGRECNTKRTLVLSDLHIPSDNRQLPILLEELSPDEVIFNGDIFDCRSFNPHSEYEASHADFQKELDEAKTALSSIFDQRMRFNFMKNLKTLDNIKFLWGNHEDFIRRFTRQFPQFESHFNKVFTKLLQTFGSVVSMDDNEWLVAGHGTIIHHGSADIFGTGGSNLEKTARTFQRSAIIGHTHSPAIRFGVYRTGCLCKMDQGYNNSQMSNWTRGYAIIYTAGLNDFIELRNWF